MTVKFNVNLKTVSILLVEDSKSDARLIKEFFKEVDFNNILYAVNDGIKALEFLYKHYKYSCPDIVILDLNLPGMSGIEVLKEIKCDANLRHIPVIILTTSTAEDDVNECYSNYANSYIVKPVDLDDFDRVTNLIKDYWFNIVALPFFQKK